MLGKGQKESCLGWTEQEVDWADLTGFSTFRLYSCKACLSDDCQIMSSLESTWTGCHLQVLKRLSCLLCDDLLLKFLFRLTCPHGISIRGVKLEQTKKWTLCLTPCFPTSHPKPPTPSFDPFPSEVADTWLLSVDSVELRKPFTNGTCVAIYPPFPIL